MKNPTRGHGLLEGHLARRRARVANRLIPDSLREGSLLDIGCGTRPAFLLNTRFSEKVGIDRCDSAVSDAFLEKARIRRLHHDIEAEPRLPFPEARFSAITCLSVLEHLTPSTVPGLISEARRVLKPEGFFICITPTPRSDRLLRWLAAIRLLSSEEIREHKSLYDIPRLESLLRNAGFRNIASGRFELGLNQWVYGFSPRPE